MRQEFLRAVPLFHDLDDEELTQILLVVLVKRFSAGASILTEEAPGGQLHIIREGQVRISKTVPGLGEEALTILGPGEFFGEACLAGQRLRMSSATAITPSTILSIDTAAMAGLLRQERGLADRFISHMLSRNARIEEDLIDQLRNSGT